MLMMPYDFYVYMSLSINDLFCHNSFIFILRKKRASGELDLLYASKILLVIINNTSHQIYQKMQLRS